MSVLAHPAAHDAGADPADAGFAGFRGRDVMAQSLGFRCGQLRQPDGLRQDAVCPKRRKRCNRSGSRRGPHGGRGTARSHRFTKVAVSTPRHTGIGRRPDAAMCPMRASSSLRRPFGIAPVILRCEISRDGSGLTPRSVRFPSCMQRMWRHYSWPWPVLAMVSARPRLKHRLRPSFPSPGRTSVARLNSIGCPGSDRAGGQPDLRAGFGRLQRLRHAGTCATPWAKLWRMRHDCNNGCGSAKADCRFMFGSCKSFFNPCGPSGGGHGPRRRWRLGRVTRCRSARRTVPVLEHCVYDSFLNH